MADTIPQLASPVVTADTSNVVNAHGGPVIVKKDDNRSTTAAINFYINDIARKESNFNNKSEVVLPSLLNGKTDKHNGDENKENLQESEVRFKFSKRINKRRKKKKTPLTSVCYPFCFEKERKICRLLSLSFYFFL